MYTTLQSAWAAANFHAGRTGFRWKARGVRNSPYGKFEIFMIEDFSRAWDPLRARRYARDTPGYTYAGK